MSIESAALGAVAGAVIGVVGAYVAAAVQRAARIHRNDVYIARGQPPVKDVVWRPPWRGLGVFGAIVGLVAGAIAERWWAGAAAGALGPALIVLTSVIIAVRPHLGR